MISINPVNFNSIDEHKSYIINPQNIVNCRINKSGLNLRLRCTLKANLFLMNPIVGLSYYEFSCCDPQHQYRFCADPKNALKITSAQLAGTLRTSGNLLVEMHTSSCHACGDVSTHCWREYTGHYVCSGCVLSGMKAPYPYGTAGKNCCKKNGCGGALYLYSEVPEKLYERVLTIYEKYRTS